MFRIYLSCILFCLLNVAGIFMVQAQPGKVSGTVTGTEGEPIPGVTVLIKNTNLGMVTDIDGNYSLAVPEGSVTLVFSFVGMKTEEVEVGNRQVINLTMRSQTVDLDELVVVAYGTQKKRDIIGSVASVKSEDLVRIPTATFDQALQGMASGVQVSSSSGVPGAPVSIKIRGISSISSGTDPLWIVDGMPVYSGGGLERTQGSTGQSPMSLINPNDIESIEVLKDAAATAIYGSRASNGVIIITTKQGKKGKGSTTIDYKFGLADLVRKAEDIGFANTLEWFSLVETARKNSNNGKDNLFRPNDILAFFPEPRMDLNREEAMNINTNWFDEILQIGNFQEVNLSSTRGFESGSFYVSTNYRKDVSVLKSNEFERFSGRVNIDFTPVKNFLVSSRISFSYTNNDRVKTAVGGAVGQSGGGTQGGFGRANRQALPWFPAYDNSFGHGYWNPLSGNNLVAGIDQDLTIDQVKNYRSIGGLFFEYKLPLINGLSFKSEITYDFIQNNSVFWITDILREDGSYASEQAVTRLSINYNLFANYTRQLGDNHFISAVAGTESQQSSAYTRQLEGQGLKGTYKQIGRPDDMLSMFGGLGGEKYLRAFFGRMDYKMLDRYLIGASFRRDGISSFEPEYRWGTFTAFSAGWILTEEKLLKTQKVMNFLKLRGSFGQTGNENIPSNKTVTTYSISTGNRYGTQDLISAGTRVTNIGVPSLTWETTNNIDLGFDYGFANNRISGSVAWYYQNVTDMLLASNLPPSAGVAGGQIWSNIGDMINQGIEFNIKLVNIDKKRFNWTTDFNFSTNSNEVTRLTPELDVSGKGIGGMTKAVTGESLWTFFMPEYAGVDPERGVNLIYEIDVDQYNATGKTVKTGRVIPATNNNLSNHRVLLKGKTSIPKWYGGFNSIFKLSNFDISVLFSYSGGDYFYDYEEQRTTDVQYGQVVLRKDLIGNTWSPENPDAKYPELRWQGSYPWDWDPEAPTEDPLAPKGKGDWVERSGNYKNEQYNFSKYLYKADYIRLKNVQAGYSFHDNLTSKIGISQLRIYVSGTNLWTWTPQYKGWDPETQGVNLPPLKYLTVGATVTF
jgi:TonB-dependent starch-binding outer membrane protein SusC